MSNHSWLRGRTIVYQQNHAPQMPQNDEAKSSLVEKLLMIPKMILKFVWRVIRGVSLTIGLFIVLGVIIGIWAASGTEKPATATLPDKIALTLKLDGEFPEANGTTELLSLIQMDKAPLTLEDVVDSLDKASKDKKVQLLIVKARGGGFNLAQLQTLRDAVLRFKAQGKKTIIYSESYGEGGYGLGLYYFASAFDEIWMQPVGQVTIGGINMQVPFFKDLMDEYGVKAQFFQRKEYKSAMEHLTSSHMSKANRESMESLVNDMAGQLVDPIKASRMKVSKKFDDLLNHGMHTDKVALQEGLVDKLDYEDSLLDALHKKDKDISVLSCDDYTAIWKRQKLENSFLSGNMDPNVAIIPVEGMIVSGSTSSSPYGMGDKMAGASDIVQSIEDAANTKSIKTIVLRVNSPGGSPTASETIHRALVWAKNTQKKRIVVSMGSVAASGGYWIATPADKIYAMNASLTGSIGVVGGKVNLQGAWDKFHVNWDTVKYGENSGMMSFNTPFSDTERTQFELTLDSIYDYFIQRVAEGRKLTPEQVEKIAKGRAYTGKQALALGLVDEIGGMDKVLDDIAISSGLTSRDDLRITYLPMTNDPLDIAMMLLSERIGVQSILQKVGINLSFLKLMAQNQGLPLVYDEQSSQILH